MAIRQAVQLEFVCLERPLTADSTCMHTRACHLCHSDLCALSCSAGHSQPGRLAYRRQLKQDSTAVTIVQQLISGNAQQAGQAIADASANNDVQGIASALTSATVLVGQNISLNSCKLGQLSPAVARYCSHCIDLPSSDHSQSCAFEHSTMPNPGRSTLVQYCSLGLTCTNHMHTSCLSQFLPQYAVLQNSVGTHIYSMI